MAALSTGLPVHFFTIVLNGEPYIRHHIEAFGALRVPWHWHIIEGVASLSHDTAWSTSNGGRVPGACQSGRSTDGTTEYLDTLAREYPHNITVYRKPLGSFWDGKVEMVRAPLENIRETCILWQIDSDELWTAEQIHKMHEMFRSDPERHAAWFWCHYFVGPDKIIATRNCYAQNPNQEWLRAWRYSPGMEWVAHEPPTLTVTNQRGERCDVGRLNPFRHSETEAAGLVFQHMSYTTEAQVAFKEQYYGYSGALERWRALQRETKKFTLLREFFPWVRDSTLVASATGRGIVPLMASEGKTPQRKAVSRPPMRPEPARIAIDGVFFQLHSTGIARLWKSLLERWSRMGYADQILLLDRAGTMPSIPGFRYRTIAPHRMGQGEDDRRMLQDVLDQEGIPLFASTYYTSVPRTKTLQMVYDMIPEVLEWNLYTDPMWMEKRQAFDRADHFVCISENTRRDLHRFFPRIGMNCSEVTYPGIDTATFSPASVDSILEFHARYSLSKPYFLMVGSGTGYKNGKMLADALSLLPSQHGFDILVVSRDGIPAELAQAARQGVVRVLPLSDQELCAAYSAAVAFVYPSMYEGFGLPVLEAMACGCPVISNHNSSLPEVGGDAVLYATSPDSLAAALAEVQKPETRNQLIQRGCRRVPLFSWDTAAEKLWARIEALSGQARGSSWVEERAACLRQP